MGPTMATPAHGARRTSSRQRSVRTEATVRVWAHTKYVISSACSQHRRPTSLNAVILQRLIACHIRLIHSLRDPFIFNSMVSCAGCCNREYA